jgi:hypothetical protein
MLLLPDLAPADVAALQAAEVPDPALAVAQLEARAELQASPGCFACVRVRARACVRVCVWYVPCASVLACAWVDVASLLAVDLCWHGRVRVPRIGGYDEPPPPALRQDKPALRLSPAPRKAAAVRDHLRGAPIAGRTEAAPQPAAEAPEDGAGAGARLAGPAGL